jgi:hypothetical protein
MSYSHLSGGAYNNKMRAEIVEIFHTYQGFLNRIKAVFGEVDEEQQAIRVI